MRITILQGAFFPVPPRLGGAVEKIWHALGREFARRGHRVVHVSRLHGDLPAREVDDAGVEHRRVRGFDTPRSLAVLKALDGVYTLRAWGALPAADVLVSNTFWLPLLPLAASRGKVYVNVNRFPKGQIRFYRRAARLQAVSGAVLAAMRAEAPALADRMTVVPNPLPEPPDADDAVADAAPRAPEVLYAGRIHPEKGVGVLIEAFARFLRGPGADAAPWRLALVGPWEQRLGGGGESYRRELTAQAAALGLPAGRLEWAGFLADPGELAARYRRAALFVYPSRADRGESFGLAPLEAMARGCPTVVSYLACFRDFIVDDRTGRVFDHRGADPAGALAGLLREVLLAPAETRRRLGRAGLVRAREFSREAVATRFLEDFAEVLREKPLPRG